MGPIPLEQWGPPMENVVYILLGRDNEKFSPVYVDQCTKSDDEGFFTKNPRFKCWLEHARSEKNLHVAIRLESSPESRRYIVDKIISKYRPACNMPDTSDDAPSVKCACCGANMDPVRSLEKSDLYRCSQCGISDTRLK